MSSAVMPGEDYRVLFERNFDNFFLRKTEYLPGSRHKTHYHEDARFVFVIQGDFLEKYDREERFCKPFTCIFRPPLEKHSEIYGDGAVCLSINLSGSWLEQLGNHSIKLERSADVRSRSIAYLTNKLCAEMIFDDDVSRLAIDALLTEVAVETHRSLPSAGKEKSPLWLKTVIEYINENSSANLSLNEIALIAGVHPVYLSRVFRKTRQCTVSDYIRRIRIERSTQMLIKSNLTLAQIAAENGFADQSHFTKVFKRLTNKTPAELRKQENS